MVDERITIDEVEVDYTKLNCAHEYCYYFKRYCFECSIFYFSLHCSHDAVQGNCPNGHRGKFYGYKDCDCEFECSEELKI